MRLIPREEKFYQFFRNQAELIRQATELLHKGALGGDAGLRVAAERITVLESKGDEIIHEIFTKLNQTFITPLDPEDIHTLGSCLDDVLDGVEDAAFRMSTYRIVPVPEPVIQLCRILENCGNSLVQAFHALETGKAVLEHCIELNRLEDEADQIERRVTIELFEGETDPIRLIKLKEIYQVLEETTDACENVADALQNVIVKNG